MHGMLRTAGSCLQWSTAQTCPGPSFARKTLDCTKNVGECVCAGIREVGAMVKTPVANLLQFVPGLVPLQSSTNDNCERIRDMQARQAECKNKPEEFIESLR